MSILETTNSTDGNVLQKRLTQVVEVHCADLIDRYQQTLREGLFSNRAEVRPNMLKQIAVDETKVLLNFLNEPAFSSAERGLHLYQIGLSERVLLRIGQVTRQFFLAHLERDHIAPMLEIVDSYQEGVILGFIKNLEKYHLDELERTRDALQRNGS